MKRESHELLGVKYWITADNFLVYEGDVVVNTGEYVAFFSFQVPGALFGESVKDRNGITRRFSTEGEAIKAAKAIAEFKIAQMQKGK